MSTRAYKLIEIKTEDEPTFNLSHDERIRDIGVYNDEGTFTIPKDNAEELLKEVSQEIKHNQAITDEGMEELKYIYRCLTKIIADCGDEDYAEYYCY